MILVHINLRIQSSKCYRLGISYVVIVMVPGVGITRPCSTLLLLLLDDDNSAKCVLGVTSSGLMWFLFLVFLVPLFFLSVYLGLGRFLM